MFILTTLFFLTASPAATLTSIAVDPVNPLINAGQTQAFIATGTFDDGSSRVLGEAAAAMAAGHDYSCALLASGSILCWGYNSVGQLGTGSGPIYESYPLGTAGLSGAAKTVATGYAHSCAVLKSGAVQCWGYNGFGQLGNGSTINSKSPVTASGIGNAVAVAAGGNATEGHSCAVLADGTAECWGFNGSGQLGNGGTTRSTVPVQVSGLSTATAIAAADDHNCAVLSSGSVQCWGDNSYGQLGDGTQDNSGTPVTVSGISSAKAIAVGEGYSCALLNDNTVRCWGDNSYGQLGSDPGTLEGSFTPVAVSGITAAAAISAGADHSCALLSDSTVKCWGHNGDGQLGDGTLSDSYAPVAVSGITAATAISTGDGHSCAVLTNVDNSGEVRCWGRNNYGELGNGTLIDSGTPVTVSMIDGVVWTSSDVTKATISGNGTKGSALALAPGDTEISASIGDIRGSATLSVQATYTIGGSISGLSGSVVLKDNGGDGLSLSGDGSFTFATALATGSAYNVTVSTQPTGQSCVVTNGTGIVGSANVTTVQVTCATIPPATYTIGGTISGLSGSIVLRDNGADDLPLSANGSFTFPTALATGSAYNVSIVAQPAGQKCTVTNHAGTVGDANVTSVKVTCATATYTIGGTVSGLSGSVVIKNNDTDSLSLSMNSSFIFPTALATGSAYNVTVAAQPTGQNCIVTNGTGTVGSANVTNIQIACTTLTYTIGGTVSGLSGSVVLKDNGGDKLSLSTNGSFTFLTALATGKTYNVTVATQPVGQICVVANGAGTVGGANVTNVTVTCAAATYTIGGTVSGLSGSVVLKDNGTDSLSLSANGGFTFPTALVFGSAYSVAVTAQPTGQNCVVTNGTGTVGSVNVTNIQIACTTNTYTIGGMVSGLSGSVVLKDNGADQISLSSNGGFAFPTALAFASTYSVTIAAQPAGQSCVVTNGAGTVGSANVTDIQIACTTNIYTIGGTVSGLSGSVVLKDNGADQISLSSNGGFAFPTALAFASAYSVTIAAQPTGQSCVVTNGAGTVGISNVSNVQVTCTTLVVPTYTVGGTISGLSGNVVLEDNGSDSISLSADGSFTFATALATGGAYNVTVAAQPVGQNCAVTNGTGTVAGAAVTNVQVTCATLLPGTYTIGGTISGLSGSVVLQDNGTDDLSLSADGSFTFPAAIATGSTYDVSVAAQPAGQSCVVANGTGTVGSNNVTDVAVSCTDNAAGKPPSSGGGGGGGGMSIVELGLLILNLAVRCAGPRRRLGLS